MEKYTQMKNSVLEGDMELAEKLAIECIENKMDLNKALNEGFLKGINEAGQLYEDEEYFLPDLICSAEAMKAAMAVLEEEFEKTPGGIETKGTVLVATVQGDVHDIGKTIVGAMLNASGFDVIDLGADVSNDEVIKAIKEKKPDIIGLSALLTTTMEEQRNIVELLDEIGIRDDVQIMVGGAPVTRDWAEKITADGYSDDAISAVVLANKLLEKIR